jgi:deoxyhypusine monooxygenase
MAPTQLVSASADTVARFERKLTDQGTSLAEKYRILFSLRNISGDQAHAAMLTGLKDRSALYRHEVAYCLGQRQDPAAVQALKAILHDTSEHGMVRHEAGEALGAIGTPDCIDPLREHEHDAVREVAETCQLAMQRIKFFESAEGKQLMDDSPYNSVVGIELDRDARSARSHARTLACSDWLTRAARFVFPAGSDPTGGRKVSRRASGNAP